MIDGIPGKAQALGRPRKETTVKPKVVFGSIAGATLLLIGIGGTWVILNIETVAAKVLELGVKFAAKRGVEIDPATAKTLLELSGGAAGASAGAAGRAAASSGQRASGKARQTGNSARRRVTKAERSSG
jgi:hypothetical protein